MKHTGKRKETLRRVEFDARRQRFDLALELAETVNQRVVKKREAAKAAERFLVWAEKSM